jgi:hypothetical protein
LYRAFNAARRYLVHMRCIEMTGHGSIQDQDRIARVDRRAKKIDLGCLFFAENGNVILAQERVWKSNRLIPLNQIDCGPASLGNKCFSASHDDACSAAETVLAGEALVGPVQVRVGHEQRLPEAIGHCSGRGKILLYDQSHEIFGHLLSSKVAPTELNENVQMSLAPATKRQE